jgi:hypothetical protein
MILAKVRVRSWTNCDAGYPLISLTESFRKSMVQSASFLQR